MPSITMARLPSLRRFAVAAALAGLALCGGSGHAQAPAPAASGFAAQIAALSEADGYFDTDNLISNETPYLQVAEALADSAPKGGVYIGVGPDQNFSYIGRIRPSSAFIIDIRRDNLLLHLLFKAIFALAPTRAEYLSLLTGRPATSSVPSSA